MWMDKVLRDLCIYNEFTDADNNGWKSTKCCHCSDHKRHLGINIESGAVKCFRCGSHPLVKTLCKLSNKSSSEVISILKNYRTFSGLSLRKSKDYKSLKFTYNESYNSIDRSFLRKRKFSPRLLKEEWDLRGSTHLGKFHHRLIIPIYFQGKIVAFQGRDVTGKSELRYLSSSKETEGGLEVKETLYGFDKANLDRIIIVEGPADVWRLGAGAVATYGTQFTFEQIMLMARFSNRFIMYDNEHIAQDMAESLAEELSIFSGYTEIIKYDAGYKDAGEMSEQDAEYVMKQLGFIR